MTSPRAGRLDQYFYFCMSLLIVAVVAFGFGQTVETKLLHPVVPRPPILYLHAGLSCGWVLFFVVQSGLVRFGRVRWHRLLGWFGVGLGALMSVVGFSTAIIMARFNLSVLHAKYAWANLLVSFYDISAFTLAFGLAIYWRKEPELHRRLQLLAVCALTAAAFGRFPPRFSLPMMLYTGVDLLILLAVVRDLVVDRRIHAVYAVGLPGFLLCQAGVIYTLKHHSAWWLKLAHSIVG